jgi:hypothetical protein
MTRDTPAPLFYPFETGDLAMPSADARAIWFGAAPGMRPPGNLRAALDCVQGFRPDPSRFNALDCECRRQQAARVMISRSCLQARRGQNEAWLAEAIERNRPGGMLALRGGKTAA